MADEKSYHGEQVAQSVEPLAGIVESPFCGSLRSKKFFMTNELATDAAQYLDSTEHCWCRETQMVIGPDGGRSHPSRCVPGRACYSSALKG